MGSFNAGLVFKCETIFSFTGRSAFALPADSRIVVAWVNCSDHSTAQFKNIPQWLVDSANHDALTQRSFAVKTS